jgi:hypothetical protein
MSEMSAIRKITAQDLILFIGLPCAIYELNADGTINTEIEPVGHYIEGVDINNNKIIAERVSWEPVQIKPILKRLSELTVEDTVFINCDIIGHDRQDNKTHDAWNVHDLNDVKEFGCLQFVREDSIFVPQIIEYLIRKGYNLHLLPHGSYLLKNRNGMATID